VIGEEMIEDNQPDRDLLRIGHSEIGGWDYTKSHTGKNDKAFMNAWKGKSVKEFIHAQWKDGVKNREDKYRTLADYKKIQAANKKLLKENADLKAQLGNSEFNVVGKALITLLKTLGYKK
jgi:hypothetical protein